MNEKLILEKAKEVRFARYKWELSLEENDSDKSTELFEEYEDRLHELEEIIIAQ